MNPRLFLISVALLAASGCDQVNQKLGLEDPAKKEARVEAEAKAVGSACRHSGRAIEDCYSIYGWLPKAGVYTGWREMDEYMRQNQIETIAPLLPPAEPPGAAKRKKPAVVAEPPAESPAPKESEAAASKDAGKEAGKEAGKDAGKASEKH